MSENLIYATLENIFREVFSRGDIKLSSEMTSEDIPGWDSFKQIEIILALEEHYHIKFSTRELDSLQSVGDLARVVASRV